MAERTVLDETLLRMLPLVHEANMISNELGKGMRFAVKLVAKATDGSASNVLGLGQSSGGDGQVALERMRTEIAILVHHGEQGQGESEQHQSMWSQDKFNNRVYLMREMHQQ
eukprot:CAMPEP_0119529088 /NCGR_PEP_ID=MMETSP1344-20130328/43153_1 /TAXON_ID=236787 /ORGANISM="Florenciella parvula, Strain CCMP2471" /LENGTH=111 /DNA_ID=CAMNT_0007568625 /DNA_START=1 /DNA_END=333 /DNA_ORIENTATION=-